MFYVQVISEMLFSTVNPISNTFSSNTPNILVSWLTEIVKNLLLETQEPSQLPLVYIYLEQIKRIRTHGSEVFNTWIFLAASKQMTCKFKEMIKTTNI
jgi:hypothetical protein